MNNTFSSQTLAEKLSKLNSSQQSIETLSKWCILHRKKAKQIVEKWEKLFNSSPMEQRTSFLYLANDIIQNSKRKGSEFVNEFWKVLPGALKNVCENGDDLGKKAVTRLVGIWDERKVFGSRRRGLKEEILGKVPPPPLSDNNGNNSNPIKVVRKDANSLRIKLAVGEMPEKIITSYQRVLDEHSNEDTALNKCKAAVSHIQKMEKDVTDTCTQGIQEGSLLMNEVQKQETILKDCIDQLVSVETSRAALIALLKEALQEQELELELISGQLQVARAETERASSIKQILVSAMTNTIPGRSPSLTSGSNPSTTSPPVQTSITEPNLYFQTPSTIPSQPLPPLYSFSSLSAPLPHLSQLTPFINSLSSLPPEPSETVTSFTNFLTTATPRIQPSLPVTASMNSTAAPPPPPPTVTSFTDSASADEQNKRAAAALAEKLTASASSAEVLTSVLSSLVAEEAASMNSGLGRGVFTSNPHIFPVNKRAKLEKPISISDTNNGFFGHLQPQQMQLPQVSPTSIQSQTNQLPPPPPLPPSRTNQTLPSPPLPPSRTNQTLPSPPLPPSQTNQPRPPPPPPLPMMPPPPPVQQHVQSNGAMVGIAPYSYRGNTLPPPPPPLPPVPPPQHQQFSTMTGFFQQ